MAGIFVKGMSMPEDCGACPMALLTHYGERQCFITESDVTGNATWAMDRHENCPLEEREE